MTESFRKKLTWLFVAAFGVLMLCMTASYAYANPISEDYFINYNAVDGKFYKTYSSAGGSYTFSDEITTLNPATIYSSDTDEDGIYETVTLNGFEFSSSNAGTAMTGSGVLTFAHNSVPCTLVLTEGSVNSISATNEDYDTYYSGAVAAGSYDGLTITGAGTLNISCAHNYAFYGKLSITGGAQVNATSMGNRPGFSCSSLSITNASAKGVSYGGVAVDCKDLLMGEESTLECISNTTGKHAINLPATYEFSSELKITGSALAEGDLSEDVHLVNGEYFSYLEDKDDVACTHVLIKNHVNHVEVPVDDSCVEDEPLPATGDNAFAMIIAATFATIFGVSAMGARRALREE